jgi:hypothetical protein
MPELTTVYITSPYVDSRVDSNTFTMGNPTPESTLSPSLGRRIWHLKTLISAWCITELLASWAFFPCRWKKSRFVTDVRILFEEKSLFEWCPYRNVQWCENKQVCNILLCKHTQPWLFPSYFVYIHQGGGKDERWCKLFYSYSTIYWSTDELMSSVLVLSIKIIDCVAQCSCHPSIVKNI